MRRLVLIASGAAAALLLLGTGLAAAIAVSAPGREAVRRLALGQLRRAVDGSVRMGSVSGLTWSAVDVRDVEFDDASGRPVLRAARVRVAFALLDLARGRYALRRVWISRPTVALEEDSTGTWNVVRLFRAGLPDTGGSGRRPFVELRDARITDGTLVIRPWEGRTLRFLGVDLDLRRLRASHPDSSAVVAEVRDISLRMAEPSLRIGGGSGHLVIDGDSVTAALDRIELPESRISARVLLRTGGPHLSFQVAARAERLGLADISWLAPAVPRSGGGRLELRAAGTPDGGTVWDFRQVDLHTAGSRVRGDLRLAVGASGRVAVGALDLTALPIELALLRPLVDTLPLDGLVRGRVRASGPLDDLRVDAGLEFEDALPGRSVSTLSGRGRLALGGTAGVGFRSFVLAPADLALATLARLAPAVVPGGRLRAEGTLDGAWTDATFEGHLIHSDGAGPPSVASGRARLALGDTTRLDAALVLDSLSFDGLARSYPGIPLRGRVAGFVRVSGPVSALELEADVGGPSGRLEGNGRAVSGDSALRLELRGRIAGVDVSAHLPSAPPTSLSGAFAADLLVPSGGDGGPVTGEVRLSLGRSRAAGVTFARAGATVALERSRFRVDTLYAEHESGSLLATGALGRAGAPGGQVTFSLRADTIGSFAPVVRWLRRRAAAPDERLDLEGSGRLDGRVVGTTETLEGRGVLHLASFRYGGLGARSVDASAQYQRGARLPVVRFEARIGTLEVAGLRARDVRLSAAGPLDTLLIDAAAGLGGGGALRVAAAADVGAGTVRVRLDTALLALRTSSWSLSRSATLSLTPDSAAVDELALVGTSGGRVRADGALPIRGVGDFHLVADSVPVADLYALVQRDTAGVGGRVSASIRLAGAAASPTIEGYLALARGRFGEFRTPLLDGLFRYGDRLLTFKGSLWGERERVLGVRGSLPLDLSLAAVPRRRLAGPLDVRIEADSADLSAVDAFTTHVRQVDGVLFADLRVAGTWAQPELVGTASVSGGALSLPALGVRWRDVGIRLEAGGERIRVLEARLRGGGTLEVTGDIGIERLSQPVLALAIDARGFQALALRDFAGVTATGRLRLEGPFLGATLSGAVSVDEGFLAFADLVEKRIVNLDDPEFRAVVDSSLARAAEIGPSFENVFVDSLRIEALAVAMGNSFWLRSNEANIQLAGTFTVSKTTESLLAPYRMDGTLRAVRGTYRLVVGPASKDFQVTRGEVRFFGTPDLNPQLDIAAEHPVRTVSGADLVVRALIGGTLLEPRLALESDQRPPLAEAEIVSYLLFGRPSFELVGSSTAAGSDQAVLQGVVAGLAASLAAGQLEQTLVSGLGLPLDYLAIRPGASGDVLGSTRVEAGARLGERTFVTVSAGMCRSQRGGSSQLFGAAVEYRLSRRWRLEGGFEPLEQECRVTGTSARPAAPYQIGVDLLWQRGSQ